MTHAGAGYDQSDWYDTPLYYDIIFHEDTSREADFLEEVLQRHGASSRRPGERKRVLEPACGSGRLVLELARRGYQVTGFDANPAMLNFARSRLRGAGKDSVRLNQDRMESFKVRGRFDLVHCLLSTFKYLLTEEDAHSHLQRVAASLRPGGLYVLGLHLTDYTRSRPDHERWTGTRNRIRVTCNTRTWPADRKTRLENLRTRLRIESTNPGQPIRRQETRWQCRTYDAAQLKRLLRKTPALEPVTQYDFTYDFANECALDGEREDVVMVLRKKRD